MRCRLAGEVFSAQFSVGLVGRSCSGASISPTVIPPLGVRIAVDAQHPVQWRYPGQSETWQTSGVRLLTLPDGSAKLVPEANENSLWPIANDQPPLQFLVPLVADRAAARARVRAAGPVPERPAVRPGRRRRLPAGAGGQLDRHAAGACAGRRAVCDAERGDEAHRRLQGARRDAPPRAWT